jgi:SAM-dependent methyltransferase
VFDCHEIDKVDGIRNESFDVITLTNVLHHLKSPITFLNRAANKLKRGGKLIATEPFFSVLSTPIFKYVHHEWVDLAISEPELETVRGPLASANIALPWLIFFRRRDWAGMLSENYDVSNCSIRFFSAVSYMATGGISHKVPIPAWLYDPFFSVDLFLSRCFPRIFASFFTIVLSRR